MHTLLDIMIRKANGEVEAAKQAWVNALIVKVAIEVIEEGPTTLIPWIKETRQRVYDIAGDDVYVGLKRTKEVCENIAMQCTEKVEHFVVTR